ncbi:MAG: autotransporter assembly complex protein TamA [Steroidobacteraceae bacterium]
MPRCARLALLACAALASLCAHAAASPPYTVELAPTGIAKLDSTLNATSQLLALRKSPPASPYGLVARARGDRDRLKTVLESFGYYASSVSISVNGLALTAPRLGGTLAALPKGTEAHIRIAFTLGPLFRVGRIDIEGTLPPGVRSALRLEPGAPAVASDVLAAGSRLESALQDRGYAFAKVATPVAYEDPSARVLNLSFHVKIGPHVKVGKISFEGLKHTRESLVRQRLLLHTGELYDAAKVDRARRDLLSLGLFSSVSVRLGSAPDSLGRVPITFQMTERSRHTVAINAGYSSDLGGSGGVTWDDRNVFGHADELDLGASLINLGGTATTGLGYNTSAKYLLPDLWHRGGTLQFSLSGLKQDLQAYDQQAETAGVALSGRFSSVWSASAGASVEQETDIQANVHYDYTLVALPLSLIYDSTDLASPLSDPTHGTRGALNLTPTRSLSGPHHATFEIVQATLAHYIDLGAPFGARRGRTVLALRAMSGVAFGAGEFGLPPDQRFYAGGSGTVRGYRYQSVGPQFSATQSSTVKGTPAVNPDIDGIPVGGTTMDAVNIELRQRIGAHFGAVLFADGGGVSEGTNPFSASRHCTAAIAAAGARTLLAHTTSVSCVGVGAGVRYYTPIGPIRLDVAVPTVRRPNDDHFEVYIGLGQAF